MEVTFNIILFIINMHSAHTYTIIIISKLKMFCFTLRLSLLKRYLTLFLCSELEINALYEFVDDSVVK